MSQHCLPPSRATSRIRHHRGPKSQRFAHFLRPSTPCFPDAGQEKGTGRRAQVANACVICRTAKLKCSGEHPMCSRCNDRGLACEYDVLEGLTKRQQLQYDLVDRKQKLQHALGILSHLQQGTDQDAAESLARLRIGSSIEDEYLRITMAFSPASLSGTSSSAQLRPSIGEQHRTNSHSSLDSHSGAVATELSAQAALSTADTRAEVQNWNPRANRKRPRSCGNIDPQILEG